jgi:hypothetical protein
MTNLTLLLTGPPTARRAGRAARGRSGSGRPANDDKLIQSTPVTGGSKSMGEVIEFPLRTTRAVLLRYWPFIQIREAEDMEACALRGWAEPSGPSIVFSNAVVGPDPVDDPSMAVMWLVPCLMQIASELIADDLVTARETSRFTSDRWAAFREIAAAEMAMSWEDVRRSARRQGVDFTAEHLATCMIVESGLSKDLERLAAA